MRSAPLLFWLAFLALGCGDGRKVGTVSGKVTLDGQPLAGARINFQPEGEGLKSVNTGVGSYGQTDANGEYSLTLIDDSARGAIVGKHRVMIRKITGPAPAEGKDPDRPSPDLVPAEYNLKSTLTFEVQPGHNTKNWELLSKKQR
jgi:hypothetical protein